MNNLPRKIAHFLLSHERFLFVCHPSPDGDMLGSAMALSLGLKACGKKAVIYSKDRLVEAYESLPGMGSITHAAPRGGFDAVITIDCGDIKRLMPYYGKWLNETKIINIDHHKSNTKFGEIAFVDTSYAAVGEQVYEILKAMNVRINASIAFHLYLSIMTDTGNFRFSNTTSRTFEIAAALVRAGINPEDMYSLVYENRSLERLKFLSECINSLQFFEGGQIAVLPVTLKLMRRCGVSEPDTQEILDVVRTLKGVRVTLLLKEKKGNEIKISLRSRAFDVNRIASKFGGGGHRAAAGCDLKETRLHEAQTLLLQEIRKLLRTKK